jgi:membrane-bound lytic murein transglycosylase MltF
MLSFMRFRGAGVPAAALLVLFCALGCQGKTPAPAGDTSAAADSETAASANADAADADQAPASDGDAGATDEDVAGGSLQALNPPWTGDFDGMVAREVIRVLVVPSRTNYFVEKGQQRGVVYEAFNAFEQEVNKGSGRKSHQKVHVVFIPTSYDNLIPGLVEGRGDVAASGLTITENRLEKVDFTMPTAKDVSEIVVTGPQSPQITTIDDLAGKEVFVRRSSSFWEHLQELNERFETEGKQAIVLKPAPEELEYEDLLEMLNAGLYGITVVDDFIGNLWAKVLPDVRLHPDVAIATGEQIAWMIRKDSPQLKAKLDGFIKTHGKGTAFGNTVIKRYFGNTQFVKNATSAGELEKYHKLAELFRTYSSQYDVDVLLMVAQGYQESRLDQNVKSAVGAIGVMQVMPATGKELGVGDITQIEANIHAGVKYMRWMIDTYYKDEPMTKLDKALFAFASYNAGPNRIRKLRTEAAARGLDPNVWFNNVELVVAEKVGPEPVTYVSNIFKYAVAYKLVTETSEARRDALESVTPDGAPPPETAKPK